MMVNTTEVAKFDSKKHEVAKAEIRAKAERVEDVGRKYYERTGKMPDNVSVFNTTRVSRNVLSPEGLLTLGVKKPVAISTDGTGSMGGNVALAF